VAVTSNKTLRHTIPDIIWMPKILETLPQASVPRSRFNGLKLIQHLPMSKMRFTEIPDAKNNSVPYVRAHTVPCLYSEAELSDQHSSRTNLFCRDDRYFIQICCQQLQYRSLETPNRGLIALHSYIVFERSTFLLSVQGPASRWLSFGWQSLSCKWNSTWKQPTTGSFQIFPNFTLKSAPSFVPVSS